MATTRSRSTYFALQFYSVASLMPCFQTSSTNFTPSSACFRIAMIFSSLNRDFFTRVLLSENSTPAWYGSSGGHNTALHQLRPLVDSRSSHENSVSLYGLRLLGLLRFGLRRLQRPVRQILANLLYG